MDVENLRNNWLKQNYSKICVSGDQTSWVFKKLHRLLEKNSDSTLGRNILEIGAGSGEHMPFVRSGWKTYVNTDNVVPSKASLQEIRREGGIFKKADVHALPFKDSKFDRVICTCVLHHVNDPIKAIQEIIRVVKKGGQITILLPIDPGLVYRYIRKFSTLKRAKKLGMLREVELIHAIEHRNHFLSLITCLKEMSQGHEFNVSGFPLKGLRYHLNAIQIINIRKL